MSHTKLKFGLNCMVERFANSLTAADDVKLCVNDKMAELIVNGDVIATWLVGWRE